MKPRDEKRKKRTSVGRPAGRTPPMAITLSSGSEPDPHRNHSQEAVGRNALLKACLGLFGIEPELRESIIQQVNSNQVELAPEEKVARLTFIQKRSGEELQRFQNMIYPVTQIQRLLRGWNIRSNSEFMSYPLSVVWRSLINSERLYVAQLEKINTFYKIPLFEMIANRDFQNRLTTSDANEIFPNKEIFLVARNTLERLEEFNIHFPVLYSVGTFFQNLIPYFATYVQYSREVVKTIDNIKQLEAATNTQLTNFLSKSRDVAGIALADLLFLPRLIHCVLVLVMWDRDATQPQQMAAVLPGFLQVKQIAKYEEAVATLLAAFGRTLSVHVKQEIQQLQRTRRTARPTTTSRKSSRGDKTSELIKSPHAQGRSPNDSPTKADQPAELKNLKRTAERSTATIQRNIDFSENDGEGSLKSRRSSRLLESPLEGRSPRAEKAITLSPRADGVANATGSSGGPSRDTKTLSKSTSNARAQKDQIDSAPLSPNSSSGGSGKRLSKSVENSGKLGTPPQPHTCSDDSVKTQFQQAQSLVDSGRHSKFDRASRRSRLDVEPVTGSTPEDGVLAPLDSERRNSAERSRSTTKSPQKKERDGRKSSAGENQRATFHLELQAPNEEEPHDLEVLELQSPTQRASSRKHKNKEWRKSTGMPPSPQPPATAPATGAQPAYDRRKSVSVPTIADCLPPVPGTPGAPTPPGSGTNTPSKSKKPEMRINLSEVENPVGGTAAGEETGRGRLGVVTKDEEDTIWRDYIENTISKQFSTDLQRLWFAHQELLKQKNLITSIIQQTSGFHLLQEKIEDLDNFIDLTNSELIREGMLAGSLKGTHYWLFTENLLFTKAQKKEVITKCLVLKDLSFACVPDPSSDYMSLAIFPTSDPKAKILLSVPINDAQFFQLLKAQIDNQQTKVFGVDLQTLIQRQEQPIPSPIILTSNFILQNKDRVEEGLFRKGGNEQQIDSLRDLFDQGNVTEIPPTTDLFVVCDLMKLWFRSLPTPLLPHETYWALLQLADLCSAQPLRAIVPLRTLLETIPKTNRKLLEYLLKFLNEVGKWADTTKMGPENLALVFSVNVIKPPASQADTAMLHMSAVKEVFMFMIEHQDALFGHLMDSTQAKAKNWVKDFQRFLRSKPMMLVIEQMEENHNQILAQGKDPLTSPKRVTQL